MYSSTFFLFLSRRPRLRDCFSLAVASVGWAYMLITYARSSAPVILPIWVSYIKSTLPMWPKMLGSIYDTFKETSVPDATPSLCRPIFSAISLLVYLKRFLLDPVLDPSIGISIFGRAFSWLGRSNICRSSCSFGQAQQFHMLAPRSIETHRDG